MRLFLRENYLKKIRGFYHDGGIIKVITDNRVSYGPVLEDIVYPYVRAQGCKVGVGRIGK